MAHRKIIVKESVAERIAAIASFIESKGMLATAEKFANLVYDFFVRLSDTRKSYPFCREPSRALLGYKCVSYKKKYTIVFIESENDIIICEFILSKQLHW